MYEGIDCEAPILFNLELQSPPSCPKSYSKSIIDANFYIKTVTVNEKRIKVQFLDACEYYYLRFACYHFDFDNDTGRLGVLSVSSSIVSNCVILRATFNANGRYFTSCWSSMTSFMTRLSVQGTTLERWAALGQTPFSCLLATSEYA